MVGLVLLILFLLRPEHLNVPVRSRCNARTVVGAAPRQSKNYGKLPVGPIRPMPRSCRNETGIEDRGRFCNPLAPDDPSHYRLAATAKETTDGIHRGTFLFLVQGTGSPSRFWEDVAARADATFLWLSWETAVPSENKKSDFADYIFFPKSSFNRGRNRLLRRGLELEIEQGWLFEYYVFMDEDQEFMEFTSREDMEIVDWLFTGTNRSPTTVAMLIHLLLQYRPARAGIRVDHSRKKSDVKGGEKRKPCITSADLDGNVEVIHRSALEVMMPYVSKYDEVVVWVGNSMMNVRADVLLGPFSVKFNQLVTYPQLGKQKHTWYPILKFADYRHTLYCYISSCLSSNAERAPFFYASEVSNRMVARIRPPRNDHNSPPCFQMATSVDYSYVLNKEMMKANWFHVPNTELHK